MQRGKDGMALDDCLCNTNDSRGCWSCHMQGMLSYISGLIYSGHNICSHWMNRSYMPLIRKCNHPFSRDVHNVIMGVGDMNDGWYLTAYMSIHNPAHIGQGILRSAVFIKPVVMLALFALIWSFNNLDPISILWPKICTTTEISFIKIGWHVRLTDSKIHRPHEPCYLGCSWSIAV